MAARKTRQPVVSSRPEADFTKTVADSTSTVEESGSPPPVTQQNGAIKIAAIAFTVWLSVLIGLAVRTANPVTLNREQIRRADRIVEAEVLNPTSGECRIRQSWPNGQTGEPITIRRFQELAAEADAVYLFPLQRDVAGNEYSVVKTAPPESLPLVYPATDAAREQLAKILNRR